MLSCVVPVGLGTKILCGLARRVIISSSFDSSNEVRISWRRGGESDSSAASGSSDVEGTGAARRFLVRELEVAGRFPLVSVCALVDFVASSSLTVIDTLADMAVRSTCTNHPGLEQKPMIAGRSNDVVSGARCVVSRRGFAHGIDGGCEAV